MRIVKKSVYVLEFDEDKVDYLSDLEKVRRQEHSHVPGMPPKQGKIELIPYQACLAGLIDREDAEKYHKTEREYVELENITDIMQVDKKTDKLKECSCGHKPDYYTVGYGRTPYSVYCENCGNKSGYRGGVPQNIIDHWNNEARFQGGKL